MRILFYFLSLTFATAAFAQQPPLDPRLCPIALESAETDAKNLISAIHSTGAVNSVCQQDKTALKKQVDDLQKQVDDLKAKYEPSK